MRRTLSLEQLRCYWARLLDEMGARQARAAAPAAGLEPPPAFAGIYQKPVRPDEYMCEQMGTSDCKVSFRNSRAKRRESVVGTCQDRVRGMLYTVNIQCTMSNVTRNAVCSTHPQPTRTSQSESTEANML